MKRCLKNEFLNIFTILHITFLLFLIFYEFLVFPYCVGLMDNGKWLEILNVKVYLDIRVKIHKCPFSRF